MGEVAYVYDRDFLRKNLSILWAATQLGAVPDESGRFLCPYHDDNVHPNLEIQPPGEDGAHWCLCRACGRSMDVLGVIMGYGEMSYSQAISFASRLYPDQPDDVPRGPTKQSVKYTPDQAWLDRLRERKVATEKTMGAGLLSYAYGFDGFGEDLDRHLMSWGWVLDESANVLIPHFDRDCSLTCVKVKTTGDIRSWASYGKYVDLYGAWHGKQSDHLFLCEGESDCVWSDLQRQREAIDVQVLALPSGAGTTRERWIQFVRERWHPSAICLGFDADDAGHEAMARWANVFPGCKELQLPQGADVRSSGSSLSELFAKSTRR